MLSTTARISRETQEDLKKLARLTGKSLQATLADAVEAYRRICFFDALNRSVQRAKANPEIWRSELDERKAWDTTLMDGLEYETWEPRVTLKKSKKASKKRRG